MTLPAFPRLVAPAIALAAVLLLVAEEQLRAQSPAWTVLPAYVAGLALLSWATRGVPHSLQEEAQPEHPQRGGERPRARPFGRACPELAEGLRARPSAPAIALLSFSGAVLAAAAVLFILDATRPRSAFYDRATVLTILGVLAAAAGFALLRRVSWAGCGRWLRAHGLEALLVTAIIAFGAFLRVYRIDEYPPPGGLAQDEGLTGAASSLIARDPGFRPQPIHPISYYYVTGYAAQLFGDDVLTLRLVHVATGVALLPAFYLLARLLLGSWPALAVTFLLAVSRWYVNASRLMYNWMHVSLFEVLAVLGLVLGLRTRHPGPFALAGWALAEGIKGYVTFRVVLIAIVLYLVWKAIGDRRALRANLTNLGVLVLTFGLFAAPYIANVIREPYWFLERHVVIQDLAGEAARQKTTLPGLLGQNALGTLSLLAQRGERWGVENLRGTPLLDPVTAALALAGVGYMLLRWRRDANVLVLLLIAGTLAGGGVLSVEPLGRRIFGVFPVLLLAGGQVLRDAGAVLAQVTWRPRVVHLVAATALGVLLVSAAVSGIYTFFWGQARNPVSRSEFLTPNVVTANSVRALPGRPYVYLIAGMEWFHPIQDYTWLAGRPQGRKVQDLRDALPALDAPGRDVAFVIATPYNTGALVVELERLFPGGATAWHNSPYPDIRPFSVVTYYVPASVLASSQGLLAEYQEGASPSQPSPLPDATVARGWGNDGPPPRLRFARWSGALYAPLPGLYTLRRPKDAALVARIDGVEVLSASKAQATVPLARGWHSLWVAATLEPERSPPVLSWRRPDNVEETLPAGSLLPLEMPGGLLGTYQGEKQSFQAIDPVVAAFWSPHPLPPPYRVRWQGTLQVPAAGPYRFELLLLGGTARLCLDGQVAVQGQATRDLPGKTFSAPMELTAGPHTLEVAFDWQASEVSAVELRWAPPGGLMQVIPSSALQPAASAGPAPGTACPP